jgi:hypothetical protein
MDKQSPASVKRCAWIWETRKAVPSDEYAPASAPAKTAATASFLLLTAQCANTLPMKSAAGVVTGCCLSVVGKISANRASSKNVRAGGHPVSPSRRLFLAMNKRKCQSFVLCIT